MEGRGHTERSEQGSSSSARLGSLEPVDPAALLCEVLEGRRVLGARAWRGNERVFELAGASASPLSIRARRMLVLIARGASNDEARHVLRMSEASASEEIGALAGRLRARSIDLVALGPLLDHAERESPYAVVRRGSRVLLVHPIPAALLRSLTPSELAIARLVVEGSSYREIAGARGTSVCTVAKQVASLYRKLGARSRRECARALFGGERAPADACAVRLADRLASGDETDTRRRALTSG